MSRKHYRTKNYIQTPTPIGTLRPNPTGKEMQKNLSNYITPVQLQRLRTDVGMWRAAVAEAEMAYYPHRVKMQRIYIDTLLNGHVAALMERRNDLTLLRDFKLCDAKGTESEDLTAQFLEYNWLPTFMNYTLDALYFGYSLISLGDIINEDFSGCSIIRRWNISPDRYQVSRFIYALNGIDWRTDPYNNWHIYVSTPSETGVGNCGYGLFYKIAIYEIFLRNTLGFNGDFVELYSQPYRVGKTTKTTESERAELEAAIKNMGSSGWAIIDPMDEIDFLETSLAGTGWKGYENLEVRCQKTVSKMMLGHADAIDSTPGKLGAGQGNQNGANQDGSPVAAALNDKQVKDGRFVQNVINKQLLPRMRDLGFKITEGIFFKFNNDGELEEFRSKEDASNLVTAQIAQTMKNAGLQMDPKYFTERTGIDAEKIELPAPGMPGKPGQPPLNEKVKNKLKKLYGTE